MSCRRANRLDLEALRAATLIFRDVAARRAAKCTSAAAAAHLQLSLLAGGLSPRAVAVAIRGVTHHGAATALRAGRVAASAPATGRCRAAASDLASALAGGSGVRGVLALRGPRGLETPREFSAC